MRVGDVLTASDGKRPGSQLELDTIWAMLRAGRPATLTLAHDGEEQVVVRANRDRPGAARLLVVPGMDHDLNAPAVGGAEALLDLVAKTVLRWASETLAPTPPRAH